MRINFFPYINLRGYVYKFTGIREEIYRYTYAFSLGNESCSETRRFSHFQNLEYRGEEQEEASSQRG